MFSQTQAMQEVRQAAQRFVRTCTEATDEQWARRLGTDPQVWSIGDVAEHVTIANGLVLRRLQDIGQHPLTGKVTSVEDQEMPYLFYRGDEPPNVATPTGVMRKDRAAFAAFMDSINSLDRWFESATHDLRKVGMAHPVFGLLDGVQWLLYLAAHTDRHRAQVIGLLQRA